MGIKIETYLCHTLEEFFTLVPPIEIAGATIGDILHYGMSNEVVHISNTEEADYLNYLTAMEDAGFVKVSENTFGVKAGEKDIYFSATYEKDNLVVTVTHMRPEPWKRISISLSTDAYRAKHTGEDLFRNIPAYDSAEAEKNSDSAATDCKAGNEAATPVDYGGGNYIITAENTDKAEYEAYLGKLEQTGFTKYVDNGEGLGGTVSSATYTKDNLVLTVTHMTKLSKTFLSANFDLPLSKHLLKEDGASSTIASSQEATGPAASQKEVKTSLHMLELWHFGNSFVIQLKNGHFIISDGGAECETEYLLDYLESLTPEGEKPIIEAWIVTHMHRDHCGVLNAIADLEACRERILVEGLYYNEPSDNVIGIQPGALSNILYLKTLTGLLRTSDGGHPKLYRPQTGQRYYFSDITMDIVHCQEQLPLEKYSPDLNDSSTWCMFTIEGQKILIGGDAERGSQKTVIATYDSDYLDLDMFSLLHHGFNTRNDFTDYSKVKTVLVTARDKTPKRREEQNAYLKERVQEWILWGDGTKVFTFPYKIGEYKTLPNNEWKYHEGQERPKQQNMD